MKETNTDLVGKDQWRPTFKARIDKIEEAGSVRRDTPREKAFLAKAENLGVQKKSRSRVEFPEVLIEKRFIPG